MLLCQQILGTTFLGMGLVTALFPSTTMKLSLKGKCLDSALEVSTAAAAAAAGKEKDDKDTATSRRRKLNSAADLLTRCFGAQAVLCGTLLLTTKMHKFSFAVFGLAMIPFLVFDGIAYRRGLLTEFGAIGDAVGNFIFMACCWIGFESS